MIFFYCAKLVIIAVKNDISVRLHRRKDLCFAFRTPSLSPRFSRWQVPIFVMTQVSGFAILQVWSFRQITDSHFQNCDLILISQSEYSKRKPQLIIKIPLGFQCSVLFLQNRGNNFFVLVFPHFR